MNTIKSKTEKKSTQPTPKLSSNKSISIFGLLLMLAIFYSCGNGVIKGEDLEKDDAIEHIAGEKERYWQLDAGHGFFQSMKIAKDGKGMDHLGKEFTYTVNGSIITFDSYSKDIYTIIEIGKDYLKMMMTGEDTLTYKNIDEQMKNGGEMPHKSIDVRWLKGKFGTCWKFDDSDRKYSYMNNGDILDSKTLEKISTWDVKGERLIFGESEFPIVILTPLYFEYTVYEIPISLTYRCEVNADGSPIR